MDYFSGLSGQSLTFALMMSICGVAILLMLVGFFFVFRKWSRGSLEYGVEPKEGQSIAVFFKAFLKQLKDKNGPHHGQPLWKTIVLDILLQRRVYNADKLRWVMHLLIFYGWMGLFSLSGLMFSFELAHMIGIEFDIESVRGFLQMPNQFLGYMLLTGVLIAIFRRLFIKNVRETTNTYDSVLLMTLFVVILTGFFAHAGRYIDLSMINTHAEAIYLNSGLYLDYNLWTFGGLDVFKTYVQEMALTHSILAIFIGFAYIPYSKYIHAVATPLSLIVNKGGEH